MLERTLSLYGRLPHHPGQGTIIGRLLPLVKPQGIRYRTRYGVKFECDLSDKVSREIYYFGFDNVDVHALRRIVKHGMVVIDAGANIGYFSLLAAKWGAEAHGFEPFPSTAERFRRNCSLNPGLNVTVHQKALGESHQFVAMNVVRDGNSGCNQVGGCGNIEVVTLDSLNLPRVDFVKADVEGFEIAVLKGARETIERFRPKMMIEVNHSTLSVFGHTSAELLDMLRGLGYRLFVATRFGMKPLDYVPKEGEEPNVFCM